MYPVIWQESYRGMWSALGILLSLSTSTARHTTLALTSTISGRLLNKLPICRTAGLINNNIMII